MLLQIRIFQVLLSLFHEKSFSFFDLFNSIELTLISGQVLGRALKNRKKFDR